MQGPSAGGQVSSCQPRAPLSSSGRGWPNGHFLSQPGVACSPNCLQTPNIFQPYAFAHAVPTPGSPPSPPRVGPVTVLSLQGFKARIFVFVSKRLFSCPPAPWPGKVEGLAPTRSPAIRGAQSSRKSAQRCISVSICGLPPQLCGLLMASNLCPSPNSGPGTTSSLESAGGQGHRDSGLCTSV